MRRATFLVACSVLVLAACSGRGSPDADEADEDGGPTDGGELREVSMYLPFPVKSIAFTPMVIADELGYYEEEGLAVDVLPAEGSSVALPQLTSGRGDSGIIIAATALGAVAKEQNLVSVYEFMALPVFGMYVLADSPIESMADLDGHTIGAANIHVNFNLNTELANAGLTPSDVTYADLERAPGANWRALEEGRIDALYTSYNEFTTLEHEGVEYRKISEPADSDDRLPFAPLIVTEQLADDEPEVVVGMGRAISKATVFAAENPEAALAMMREIEPSEHEDPAFAELYMTRLLEHMGYQQGSSAELSLGEQSMPGWQALLEAMDSVEGAADVDLSGVDLDSFVTNEFVEEMNTFDVDAVRQQAQDSELTYP